LKRQYVWSSYLLAATKIIYEMFWYTKVDLTFFGAWQKILVVASAVTFIRLGTMSYLNSNVVKFTDDEKNNTLSAATKLGILCMLITVPFLLIKYEGEWSIFVVFLCLELFLYPLVELKLRAHSNWKKLSLVNMLICFSFIALIIVGNFQQDMTIYLLRYFVVGTMGLYSIFFVKIRSMDILNLYRNSKSYTLWVFGKQTRDLGYRLPLSLSMSELTFGSITPLFWILSLAKLLISPWGNIVNNSYQEINDDFKKREYKARVFNILISGALGFLLVGCLTLLSLRYFEWNIYDLEFIYFALGSVEILLMLKVFFLVDNLTNKLSWIYIIWFFCNIFAVALIDIEMVLFISMNVLIGLSIFIYSYGREYFSFRGGWLHRK